MDSRPNCGMRMKTEEPTIENPDREFIAVAQVDEVPSGQGRVVKVLGKTVALFNVAGRFYAINNICPHKGGPLAKGRIKGYVVSCPWHDLQFDVRNGFGTDGGGYCVASYETRVDGDQVCISLRRRGI